MPSNGLTVREREERIDRKDDRNRMEKRRFNLSVADIAGGAGGIALGATVTRGMDLGPIPVKINSAAGLVGLYLLFFGKKKDKQSRKFLTSFLLGMGAERVFEISEDRLSGILDNFMGGGGSDE